MDNYFELFDIPESLQPDAKMVRRRWQDLSRAAHPDRFANATRAEQIQALQQSSRINEGYKTLSDPMLLMRHVLDLNGGIDEQNTKLPPAFLMEIMELNEAIGNAEMAPDMHADALREFDSVMEDWNRQVAVLARRFEGGERAEALFASLKDYYFRKKYLLRLKERIT